MAPKSKNQLRREKAKKKKLEDKSVPKHEETTKMDTKDLQTVDENDHSETIVEEDPMEGLLNDPSFSDYKKIFNKFYVDYATDDNNEKEKEKGSMMFSGDEDEGYVDEDGNAQRKNDPSGDSDEEEEDDDDTNNNTEEKLSKRQFKKKFKIPLSVLKAEAKNLNLIDWNDADSPDPRLLTYLKGLHNSVPVPSNWVHNKSFLSNKRGFEKAPFELPKFILDTGILEMRDTTDDDNSTLKQRMRERVQPKMGQLDIDFIKLYDAFFKYQTKPKLLKIGEVYYEGMEDDELNQVKFTEVKPGKLSSELKTALGMPVDDDSVAPPWAQKISILGPPPSYPHMRVIDAKIIVDGELTASEKALLQNMGNTIEKSHWGVLEEEEDEDDDDEDKDEDKDNDEDAPIEGDEMIEFVGDDEPSGLQTESAADEEVNDGQPKKLYHVLKEKNSGQSGFMGSETMAYDLSSVKRKADSFSDDSIPKRKK